MNIIDLYESLREYVPNVKYYDDLFYDAPEGEAQIDIVKEMMEKIMEDLL